MTKKLLIFDYDGVIVDSLRVIHRIFQELQSKYALPPFKTREDIGALLDINFFETLTSFGFSDKQAQLLLSDIREKKLHYEDDLHLFPHMHSFFNAIAPFFICTIVTSTHEDAVMSFLRREKLDRYFQEILGGNREPSKVKKITTLLKEFPSDKKSTYFISDTTGDIEEARITGVTTIAVTWGFHNKEKLLLSTPDYLFENIEDLKKFLLKV